MPAFSNKYTVGFVAAIAVIFSLLLAVAATSLKTAQEKNIAVDKKRNILIALQVVSAKPKTAGNQVLALFEQRVQARALDSQGRPIAGLAGSAVLDIVPEDEMKKPENERRFPIYVLMSEDGKTEEAYAVPIEGKGLWSTLYGYLALNSDCNTVRGITFYKHGETPGLGGEIENPAWQGKFVGQQIFDAHGELASITVVKGLAPEGATHKVDGLSGATLTSNGVTKLLAEDLGKYLLFFKQKQGASAATSATKAADLTGDRTNG